MDEVRLELPCSATEFDIRRVPWILSLSLILAATCDLNSFVMLWVQDVFDAMDIYCFQALACFYSKYYGKCSRAFIKLESMPGIPADKQELFSELAVSIFTKHSPNDPSQGKVRHQLIFYVCTAVQVAMVRFRCETNCVPVLVGYSGCQVSSHHCLSAYEDQIVLCCSTTMVPNFTHNHLSSELDCNLCANTLLNAFSGVWTMIVHLRWLQYVFSMYCYAMCKSYKQVPTFHALALSSSQGRQKVWTTSLQ